MTTKLEIIGPYTPDHDGPYAIDSEIHSECMFARVNIHCVVDGIAFITSDDLSVPWCTRVVDLMNAREVPVPREFWINEFKRADGHIGVSHAHEAEIEAINERHELPHWNWTRTIHVREVLDGDCNCRTDTQLFDDIEKVKDYPNFIQEDDGWYASTSLRDPSGPYASLQDAVCAVVCDGLDGAAS